MIAKESVPGFVTVTVTLTLCVVVCGMIGGMLIGLFDDNINNDKIFEAITPAFQTIIGGFIGLITGIKIGQDSNATE
jgi:ABC-type transporter Mla maintaining outer membrane lipid asymmetry permease subunit MlaE